jgi:hypothetical protein
MGENDACVRCAVIARGQRVFYNVYVEEYSVDANPKVYAESTIDSR